MDKIQVRQVREILTLINLQSYLQYKGQGQVREHIYQMKKVVANLGQLGIEVLRIC